MTPPVDARIVDIEEATVEDLRDEIEQLRREVESAERKAKRWEDAFNEVEKIALRLARERT